MQTKNSSRQSHWIHPVPYRRSVLTFIVLVSLVGAARAVEWTPLAGGSFAGVIISDECPPCWFSPTQEGLSFWMDQFDSLDPNFLPGSESGPSEIYADATAAGCGVQSHIYGITFEAFAVGYKATGFNEIRCYSESGHRYFISISNVAYDDVFHVKAGYDVVVQSELRVDGSEAGDLFGYAVSIDGDSLIVGAPGRKAEEPEPVSVDPNLGVWVIPDSEDTPGSDFQDMDNVQQAEWEASGAVYVFTRGESGWSQTQKFGVGQGAEVPSVGFGSSVSISGDYAIAGKDEFWPSVQHVPAYTIYHRADGKWSVQTTIRPPDVWENLDFVGDYGTLRYGRSVAISGDYVIIGTPSQSRAHIYKRNETGWDWQTSIEPSPADESGLAFGESVAIDGVYAVVGSLGDSDNGAVYVYQREGASWVSKATLTVPDTTEAVAFGCPVSIQGDDLLVGAPRDARRAEDAGCAYVFQRENGQWQFKAKLQAPDATENERFGMSLGVAGDYITIGTQSNGAYRFRRQGGNWSMCGQMKYKSLSGGEGYGFAVAMDRSGESVVGGPGSDSEDAGTAYVSILE